MLNLLSLLNLTELEFVISTFKQECSPPRDEGNDDDDDCASSVASKSGGVAAVSHASGSGIRLPIFISVMLRIVVDALIRSGFEPPTEVSNANISLQQRVSKIATRELRDLFNKIDSTKTGAISFDALIGYFVTEIERRSIGVEISGLASERVQSMSTTGGGAVAGGAMSSTVSDTLCFEQASFGQNVFTVANVSHTPDRRSSTICQYVPHWDGFLCGAAAAGHQGFEIVDAATFRTKRIGYDNNSGTKLSTLLSATVLPQHDLIAAVSHDSTVSFWSLPGSSFKHDAGQASESTRMAAATSSSTSMSAFNKSIVCFKKRAPGIETYGEHIRVLCCSNNNNSHNSKPNNRDDALYSGSAAGVIQPWNLLSAASQDRYSPIANMKLQAHSSNVTALLAVPGGRSLFSASMDRSVAVIDVEKFSLLVQKGGRSYAQHLAHAQGILCACVVSSDNSGELTVATAGFEEDLFLWPFDSTGSSGKPLRLSDPSNPHRAPCYFVNKLSPSAGTNTATNVYSSSAYASSPYLVSGDAAGIVKVWDIRVMRCAQTIAVCRLGDDEPPPPLILSQKSVAALMNARKAHTELNAVIADAEQMMMSSHTRRVFKGTAIASPVGRHFSYSLDGHSSLYCVGPRSSYVVRGHRARAPMRADDFQVLAVAQIDNQIITLHGDAAKLWQISTGALSSVHVLQRSNLTCLAVDHARAVYFVGDSKGLVSAHSSFTGALVSNPWRVFTTGADCAAAGVKELAVMRRRDGAQLVFAISDCGHASVTIIESDESYHSPSAAALAATPRSRKQQQQQKNNSTTSSTRRRVVSLQHLSRNFLLLFKHLRSTNQEERGVIPVSLDGRIDETTKIGGNRQQQQRGGSTFMNRRGNSVFMTETRSQSRTGTAVLRSFREQQRVEQQRQQQPTRSGLVTRAQRNLERAKRLTKQQEGGGGTKKSNNNNRDAAVDDLIFGTEEVDFVRVIAYDEMSLALFAAGSCLVALDGTSLEIVHAFHVGYERKIMAATSLAGCAAVAVIDDEFNLTVFGTRPSHVANQVLAVRGLARAHPSQRWALEQTHVLQNKCMNPSQQQALQPPFQFAAPSCASFHPLTCSLLVGDDQGNISSWSLRKLKRELLLRPVRYPLPGKTRGTAASARARQLRAVSHVSAPADALEFGNEVIEFEFRRGFEEKIPNRKQFLLKRQRLKKQQEQQQDQSRRKKQQQQRARFGQNDDDDDDEDEHDETNSLDDDNNNNEYSYGSVPSLAAHGDHNGRLIDLGCEFLSVPTLVVDALPEKDCELLREHSKQHDDQEEDDENADDEKADAVKRKVREPWFQRVSFPRVAGAVHTALTNHNNRNDDDDHDDHDDVFDQLHQQEQQDEDDEFAQQQIQDGSVLQHGTAAILPISVIGNRVAFVTAGSSDCRCRLISRNLKDLGELEQRRTKENTDISLESALGFLSFEKQRRAAGEEQHQEPNNDDDEDDESDLDENGENDGDDPHRDETEEERRKRRQQERFAARILRKQQQQQHNSRNQAGDQQQQVHKLFEPWRFAELTEDAAAFVDPYVDLSEGTVARLLRWIRDIRFKLQYNKRDALLRERKNNRSQSLVQSSSSTVLLPQLRFAQLLNHRLDAVQERRNGGRSPFETNIDPSLRALSRTEAPPQVAVNDTNDGMLGNNGNSNNNGPSFVFELDGVQQHNGDNNNNFGGGGGGGFSRATYRNSRAESRVSDAGGAGGGRYSACESRLSVASAFTNWHNNSNNRSVSPSSDGDYDDRDLMHGVHPKHRTILNTQQHFGSSSPQRDVVKQQQQKILEKHQAEAEAQLKREERQREKERQQQQQRVLRHSKWYGSDNVSPSPSRSSHHQQSSYSPRRILPAMSIADAVAISPRLDRFGETPKTTTVGSLDLPPDNSPPQQQQQVQQHASPAPPVSRIPAQTARQATTTTTTTNSHSKPGEVSIRRGVGTRNSNSLFEQPGSLSARIGISGDALRQAQRIVQDNRALLSVPKVRMVSDVAGVDLTSTVERLEQPRMKLK